MDFSVKYFPNFPFIRAIYHPINQTVKGTTGMNGLTRRKKYIFSNSGAEDDSFIVRDGGGGGYFQRRRGTRMQYQYQAKCGANR